MKVSVLAVLYIIFVSSPAAARISWGPELGLNYATYFGKAGGEKVTGISPILGVRVGGVVSLDIDKHLCIQSGLFFNRNGYKLALASALGNTYFYDFRMNTIEVPVTILVTPGTRLFLGVGPYISINLAGKVTADPIFRVNGSAVHIGNAAGDDIKRLDAGLGFNAGYRFGGGVFVRAHYQFGVTNLQPGGNADNTFRNMHAGAALGFLLPAGRRAHKVP